MSKQPTGLAYVGYFINYLLDLLDPFPRGLCINLEGSCAFLPLMLSMHIDRLGLFSHLYRNLFNCLSLCLGSWVGTTNLRIEVGWLCTIACCSMHQPPGCDCNGNRSHVPLGHQNGAYMGIYNHTQPYIHAFAHIYKF